MGTILSLLRNPKVLSVLALIVLLGGFYLFMEGKVKVLQTQNKDLTDKVATLQTSLNTQNAALQQSNEDLKKAQQAMNNLKQNIDKNNQNTNNTVNSVLLGPTPKTCQDAIDYLIDGALKDLRK